MKSIKQRKQAESGNVLFLILIAVALFAALSYVVTQSTRSGGGSAEREKNVLSSAQMTQYPTALRTSVIRLVLGGVSIDNVKFNPPTSFSGSTFREVFHPSGGGATFQTAPASLMSSGLEGTWTFNGEFYVPEIGIDTAGGNDIIAFLAGVSSGICKQLNEELNVDDTGCTASPTTGVPQAAVAVTSADIAKTMGTAYTLPGGPGVALQCAAGTAFTRQPSGCFYDLAGTQYVFYSVILER